MALITYSLLPDDAAWKIIPSSDAVAWRVAGLLWAVTAVWWFDLILNLTDTVVFIALPGLGAALGGLRRSLRRSPRRHSAGDPKRQR